MVQNSIIDRTCTVISVESELQQSILARPNHVGKPFELTVLSGIDSNSKGNICGAVVTPFFPMLTSLNTFGAGPKA